MKTVLNARIDELLKHQLEVMAKEMGLSLSSLVSVALTQLAKTKQLNLSIRTENGFTEEYEDSVLDDSNPKETIFTAKTPEETRCFLEPVPQIKGEVE